MILLNPYSLDSGGGDGLPADAVLNHDEDPVFNDDEDYVIADS